MHAQLIQIGTQYLNKIDTDWAQLIAIVGPCTISPKPEREPYEALIRAVAYQQLHAKAGDAIIKRLLCLYNDKFPSPLELLETKFDVLRSCGFSVRKIEAINDIAKGTISGLVPSHEIADAMKNEDLINQLVTLKGVGRWTVEMLLIFNLERLDILPSDDFGIAEGYKRFKKLNNAPKQKEIAEIGLVWSPYRTIASWYLWNVPKNIYF